MEAKLALGNVSEVKGAGLTRNGVRLSLHVLEIERFKALAHISVDSRKILQA